MLRLLTPELEKAFMEFPLYSQDGFYSEAKCIAVFTLGAIRWFILEGERDGNDFRMFGIVVGMMEDEYGYVSLKELSELEWDGSKYGLGTLQVRQQPNWTPTPLKNILDNRLQKFLSKFKKYEEEAV